MSFQSAAGDTTLSPELQAAAAAMTATAVARAQSVANAPAYKAKGAALAELAINEARGQSSAWGRIYVSMLELESEGRAAFRSAIAAHQKAMQAHVNANKIEDQENPVYATAKRSAMTRLSELTTITKALDAGVEMDKSWPFHFAVGHARTALRAEGKGSKRGRPAKAWMDKVKEFLTKNVPEGEWDQCVDLVETLAKVKE